jgi:tRNA(fMet)-specific endonuclease VapC
MICLDTNTVMTVLNRRSLPLRSRMASSVENQQELSIPVIVLFELLYGAAKSAQPERNAQRIADFLSSVIRVLPFEQADAEEAGEIRTQLERSGTPIGPYDVLIAAQARRRNALLVTADQREFTRVSGLRVEDWTLPQ